MVQCDCSVRGCIVCYSVCCSVYYSVSCNVCYSVNCSVCVLQCVMQCEMIVHPACVTGYGSM